MVERMFVIAETAVDTFPSSTKAQNLKERKEIGISEADFQLIDELRKLVKNDLTEYYDTNFNLLRWIKGHRELPLEEIAKKLRSHLKMRKSVWDLDNMAHKPRKHQIHHYWKYGITGKSEILENVIVNIEQLGQTDYAGMLATFSMQEVLKARTQDLEDMLAKCMKVEAQSNKQASILYVMDMSGLKYDKNLVALISGALRSLTEFMAMHYVELINAFVLVNVPSFICMIWSFAKQILPERTRQKVLILSSTTWREQILELSSPKALPNYWNKPGENLFSAKIEQPLPFPIENFYKNTIKKDLLLNAEKLRIAAGKTQIITKELNKYDILEWFVSAESDFGMGIYFTKNKDDKNVDEMEVALPCLHWLPAGPTECPLNGQITIAETGFYKIWFTNQHSWWTVLSLKAKLRVIRAAIT